MYMDCIWPVLHIFSGLAIFSMCGNMASYNHRTWGHMNICSAVDTCRAHMFTCTATDVLLYCNVFASSKYLNSNKCIRVPHCFSIIGCILTIPMGRISQHMGFKQMCVVCYWSTGLLTVFLMYQADKGQKSICFGETERDSLECHGS